MQSPRPEPAPGDPDTPTSSARSVSEAEPPRCPTRTRLYRDGEVADEGFPAERIGTLLDEGGDTVVWLDLKDPNEADLRIVTEEFGLHPLAVEDALHAHQRPKLDRYHSHLFVNVYAVEVADDATVRTAEISAFVTPRALITVRKDDFDIDGVVSRWDLEHELVGEGGSGFLLHGLLDAVVDGHSDAIEDLQERADDLEDHLFTPERGFDLRRMGFRLRRSLADLRRVVAPMHDVLGRLMRNDVHLVTDALQPYYQDVNDHVQRAAENIDSARDLVANVLDANLTEQGNQLNEITKKLASWAAIIAVPTAVTGFYGQNVPFPGFDHHSGFVTSASVMVVLAVGVYLLLRRRGWL
ncbi:MAG TPA: magnesium transporter CorA family protein [Jatrophihabitantaceae bacterium]|jgi:magnesium transporter